MEILYFYFFILLASPKTNKQTDKQKERWQKHRNSCGQLQRARDKGHHHNHNHNHHHQQHELHDLVIRFLSCLGRWMISQMEIK